MIETSPVPARLRGRSTAGRRERMGKRKTGGTDPAAQEIRGRTDEAAASLQRRREGGGAAAPVGEKGEGLHHRYHLHPAHHEPS